MDGAIDRRDGAAAAAPAPAPAAPTPRSRRAGRTRRRTRGPAALRGDRRAVAAGAVHDGRRGRVELAEAVEQLRQRDVDRARDRAAGDLARVAHVDDLQVRPRRACRSSSALAVEPRGARRPSSGWSRNADTDRQVAPITRSKPMRARRICASSSCPGSRDEHDRRPGGSTSPAYSAKRPPSPTLIEPAQVARRRTPRRRGRRARRRPPLLGASTSVERRAAVAARPRRAARAPAVAVGGEREVQRRRGLALGDGVDELVLGHRRERVVGAPLLADRRLASRSTGSCRTPSRRRGPG